MREEENQPSKRSAWPIAVVLLVVMLVYVLSYAPVVRLMGGWTTYATFDYHGVPQVVKKPIFSDELPVYMPVDWLIDNTPFEDPLMEWAGFCGVRGPFVRR